MAAKLPLSCEKFQPSLKFQFNSLNSYFPLRTRHLPYEILHLVQKMSQARAPFPGDLHLKRSPMCTSDHSFSSFFESAMAKTRGAKTPSPSGRHRAPRVVFVQHSMTEPSQPLSVPPSVEGAPLSSPLRRYETRRPPTTPRASSSRAKKSVSRPPKKKARISALVEHQRLHPSLSCLPQSLRFFLR